MGLKHLLSAITATLTLFAAAISPAASDAQGDERKAMTAVQDAWIDGKLEAALLFNDRLNPFTIGTTVENGVVTLSGAVDSEIDRELAGEIAASIEGVSDVRNELQLDGQSTAQEGDESGDSNRNFRQRVADATVTARVKSQLLANSDTDGLAINVDTEDGVVTLRGSVASAEEKELMARLAANAAGVHGVTNELRVEPEEAE